MWYEDNHFLFMIIVAIAIVGITVCSVVNSNNRRRTREDASYAVNEYRLAKAREIMTPQQRIELEQWEDRMKHKAEQDAKSNADQGYGL